MQSRFGSVKSSVPHCCFLKSSYRTPYEIDLKIKKSQATSIDDHILADFKFMIWILCKYPTHIYLIGNDNLSLSFGCVSKIVDFNSTDYLK